MRLSDQQKKVIIETFRELFPNHKLYLYGSRVDQNSKGGDIDLLIVGKTYITLREKNKFKIELFKKLGEQKIDIVSYLENDYDSFYDLIKEGAILLC